MLGALVYLRLMSAQNWLRSRLRRLRQPKYLAGAIVGAAYFWFFFFRPLTGVSTSRGRGAGAQAAAQLSPLSAADFLPTAFAIGALALLGFLLLMWLVPRERAAFGFSEAEIAFLFPAPIPRRTLVHFRLLTGQISSFIGGAFLMLFSNRWSAFGGNAVTHAIGWWVIFSAINLHFTGSSFAVTRLTDHGVNPWRRRLALGTAVAALLAITVYRLPHGLRWPSLADASGLSATAEWAETLAGTAPLAWVLWPLQLLLAPFLALDTKAFLFAIGPAVAIITLHYLWVVNTAVSFEDATLQHAEKRAARVAAWRAGDTRIGRTPAKGRRPPFFLMGTGRPELAFLWKNLLSTWPYFTPRVFGVCAFVIALVCTWLGRLPEGGPFLAMLGFIAGIFCLYALVVGPQFARQDIRSDLPNTDILKTYPLAGWQVVLGELLAPAAILTGVLWLGLLTVALALPASRPGFEWLTPSLRFVTTVSLALITPVLVTLQLLVPNAAALLFPGWFQASRGRGGGVEVIGQRMIFFFAQLVTMLLALAPAALFAALLIFILQAFIGATLAVAIAAGCVLLILVGEVWCGLWWLGERFDRLDLSSELRA